MANVIKLLVVIKNTIRSSIVKEWRKIYTNKLKLDKIMHLIMKILNVTISASFGSD